MTQKGSKKHVLNLIDREDFISTLNTILQPYEALMTDRKSVQPKGEKDVSEYGIQFFITKHNLAERFPLLIDFNFDKWWKPSGGKAPTWDMISLCKLKGKDALLLVEAKAHKSELSKSPKTKLKEGATEKAENNLINIGNNIKKACDNLNAKHNGFKISIDSHYQLSNRVTFGWQLNQLDVPVVLLYLGFIGDDYFTKDFFKDDLEWKEKFNKYITGIVPIDFINEKKSDFLFIHSALPVKK